MKKENLTFFFFIRQQKKNKKKIKNLEDGTSKKIVGRLLSFFNWEAKKKTGRQKRASPSIIMRASERVSEEKQEKYKKGSNNKKNKITIGNRTLEEEETDENWATPLSVGVWDPPWRRRRRRQLERKQGDLRRRLEETD